MSTITIKSDERDVIVGELCRWTNEGDPVPFDTREAAAETLAKLTAAFEMRDVLGWNASEHDSYTVTVTDRLVDLLRVTERDVKEALVYDRNHRQRIVRDEPGWRWPDVTPEENLAQHDRMIAGEELTARACADLLARIDEQMVTV